MPIPKPEAGESSKDFIARCMADPIMEHEYSDAQQRAGVCYAQYEKRGKGASRAFATYSDKTQPSSRAAYLEVSTKGVVSNMKMKMSRGFAQGGAASGLPAQVEDVLRRAQAANNKKDKGGQLFKGIVAAAKQAGMKVRTDQTPEGTECYITYPGVRLLFGLVGGEVILTTVTRSKSMSRAFGSDKRLGVYPNKAAAQKALAALEAAGIGQLAYIKENKTTGQVTLTAEAGEDWDKCADVLAKKHLRGIGFGRGFARKVGDWTMIGKTKASVEEVKAFLKKAGIKTDTTDVKIRRNGVMTEVYVITANQRLVTKAEDAWAVSLFEASGAFGRAFAVVTKEVPANVQTFFDYVSKSGRRGLRDKAAQDAYNTIRSTARGVGLTLVSDEAVGNEGRKMVLTYKTKSGGEYKINVHLAGRDGKYSLVTAVYGGPKNVVEGRMSRAFARGNALLEFKDRAAATKVWKQLIKAGIDYCMVQESDNGTFLLMAPQTELGTVRSALDKIPEARQGKRLSRAFGTHDAIIAKAKAAPNFEVATDILENAGFYPAEEGRNFIWWRKGNTWVKTVKGAGGKATITVDPSHKFNERNAPMNYSRAFGTGFEKAWKGKLDDASVEDLQEALERAFKDKIRYYDTAGVMVVESDPTSTRAVKTFIERWLQKNKGKGASLRDHDDPKCVLTYACAQTYGEGKRFQKDAITCGVYKHPKHGWTMNVTPERIDKWVKNMARMQAKGVPIPLVKDHVVNSDTTLGYVQGGHRDGNVLRVISEVPDDESAKKLKTVNNVSIYVERDFKDGTGEVYDEAITHIALTPEPVVPGQAGFISIAASSGQSSLEVPVYSLATDQGVSPMRRELNARFRELVKAATDRAEDDLLADVDEFITSKMEENNRLTEEVSSLKGQLEALASVDHTTSTLTEDEAEERTNDVVEELDDMVGKGMLTPALAASLRGTLCGDASARNDYMLSRCETPNDRGIRPVRAKQLLSLIKQIKPMKLGSQTQGQGMSRSTPEPEGNKLTDRLVAMAQPTDPKSLVM